MFLSCLINFSFRVVNFSDKMLSNLVKAALKNFHLLLSGGPCGQKQYDYHSGVDAFVGGE